MQSCLEKRGIEERNNEIVRSDYNIEDQYGSTHKNAISDGDVKGKGTGHARAYSFFTRLFKTYYYNRL